MLQLSIQHVENLGLGVFVVSGIVAGRKGDNTDVDADSSTATVEEYFHLCPSRSAFKNRSFQRLL
tara:strand:+ start:547 stop:741 length:195 start_codon:yes stop_codon:yes gene_type:complete